MLVRNTPLVLSALLSGLLPSPQAPKLPAPPAKKEVWGRPSDCRNSSDGALLMSDDGGRKIRRISYSGK